MINKNLQIKSGIDAGEKLADTQMRKTAKLTSGVHNELINAQKISAVLVDLDMTLWNGIAAEKQALTLRKDLYSFLVSLERKGVNIFVVSKNDRKDVDEAMQKLGIDTNVFTHIVANWDSKYLMVERLLEQTGIPEQRTVFLDDNPHERIEVKLKMPKIHCVDAEEWEVLSEIKSVQAAKAEPEFDIMARKNRYRTAIGENLLKQNTADDESLEFLQSLKREITLGQISIDKIGGGREIDRFTKLFVETHRINFNPNKFDEYDKALSYLYARAGEGDRLIAISAREFDFSLGLTGALVMRVEGEVAQITDGTFSCGIIGRGFEQKVILSVLEMLKDEGVQKLEVFVTLTGTNRRVRDYLEELGFVEEKRKNDKTVYSINPNFVAPKKTYEWIGLKLETPEMHYTGHPAVISFFERNVKPIISDSEGFDVLNIGSARGEVIGHLQDDARAEFYRFMESRQTNYVKVDMEPVAGEGNIVANAENLRGIVDSNSQDVVMAIELLEHTEHFWKVINESLRVCKTGGYIFITVPSFDYPKHEYPIDQWRIGPKTLQSFFPQDRCRVVALETESVGGSTVHRTMILVQKIREFEADFKKPADGRYDSKTGLTIFE